MTERPLLKRLAWLAAAWAVQMLYFPTALRTSGGIEPKIPLDALVPIWPIWVVPYALCYPLWLGAFLYAALRMEAPRYRALLAACFFTFSLGILTFVLFPTYVESPALPGADIFSATLRILQAAGGFYDALPSGHIYVTTLLALFYSRWRPRQKWLWLAVWIVVALSTLFTGQHYILDVIAGLALGWAGFRFGVWWMARKSDR